MVHAKLQKARVILASKSLKKSGQNRHHGFSYFELGDFLPEVQKIFAEVGLCGRTWFDATQGYLCIYDSEDITGPFVLFSSPTAEAKLAKGTPIQELGAMHTYMRRYLWVMAMEIVENDIVDAQEQADPAPTQKAKPTEPRQTPPPMSGANKPWQLSIAAEVTGGIDNWTKQLKTLLDTTLGFAKSVDDVNEIFRVNRNIFDTLKGEDEFAYADVLKMFKTTKESFAEKQ